MANLTDFAVVYDITSDRERRRLDKLLKGFGFRVQKSVYECRLTQTEYKLLKQRISSLNIETGFVKIYRLIYSNHQCFGNEQPINRDNQAAFIV